MKKHLLRLLSILTIGLILLFLHTIAIATETTTTEKSIEQMSSEYSYPNVEKAIQGDAAQTTTAPDKATNTLEKADKLVAGNILARGENKLLAAGFLLMGMICSLYCVLYFIRKTRHGADDIVHASGLVLLIFGTIILVVIVNVEQQLTAAMGILGAIAGYLFGSLNRGKEEKPAVSPDETK